MGNLEINIDEIPPGSSDFDALPKGKYDAIVSDSSVKNTKGGTGKYLALEFTIFDEYYAGRKVWTNLNIKNDSEKAQQIGLGMLSSLCKACGKTGIVDDSSQLHDIPISIKLDIEPDQNGKDRNKVTAFFPKGDELKSTGNKAVPAKFSDDDIAF